MIPSYWCFVLHLHPWSCASNTCRVVVPELGLQASFQVSQWKESPCPEMAIMGGCFGSSPQIPAFLLPSHSSGILTRMECWKIGTSGYALHVLCRVQPGFIGTVPLTVVECQQEGAQFFRFPELFVARVEAHLMSWFPWGCANFLPVLNDPISSWTHTAKPEKGFHTVTFWGGVCISSNEYVLISSCNYNQRFDTPAM